jgi:hypothetical protein
MAEVGLTRIERGVAMIFAVLLLVFQLAIPQGFMLSAGPQGPAIVVCTGHGPLTLQTGEPGRPSKAPHAKSDGACPFAGHGGAPLTPEPPTPTAAAYGAVAVLDALKAPDLLPGRGLAAPPPPSRGPPVLLI